jgi:hypothetical protein
MDNQEPERLLALWKSGRDKYRSFFAVLVDVKREIGIDALPAWCRDNLRISLSIIENAIDLLAEIDAKTAKEHLAGAKAAEKAQAQAAREKEALDRELRKIERQKKIAEAKLEMEQAKAAVEKAKTETADLFAARRQQKKPREKRQKLAVADVSTATLTALAEAFKAAEVLCQQARGQWIEGSVMKAIILVTARSKYPNNQEFGVWCDANSIYSGPDKRNDRTALIGLGQLGEERLREILMSTDSQSYHLIWQKHKKPELQAVS